MAGSSPVLCTGRRHSCPRRSQHPRCGREAGQHRDPPTPASAGRSARPRGMRGGLAPSPCRRRGRRHAFSGWAAGWRNPLWPDQSCEPWGSAGCGPPAAAAPGRPGSAGLRQWPGSFGALPCRRLRGGCFFRFLGLVRVRRQRQRHAAVGREVLLEVGELLLRRGGGVMSFQARLFLRAWRRGGGWGAWGWRGFGSLPAGRAWGRLVQRASTVLTGRLRHLGCRRVLGLGRATAAGARCIAAGRRFGLAALSGCRGLRTGLPLLGAGGSRLGRGCLARAGLAGSLFSRRLLGCSGSPTVAGTAAATAAVRGSRILGRFFHSLFHSYRQSIARHSL